MARKIQIKRGLDANRASIIPDIGELIFTTDTKKLYLGDGTTSGGVSVDSDKLSGKSLSEILIDASRPDYVAPSGIGHTSTSFNYFKLGTIVLSNYQGAEIEVMGTAGFTAGDNCVGRTIILLRGSNDPATMEGYYYGETKGSLLAADVRYVKTADNTFDLYVKYNSTYASLGCTVRTEGTWEPSQVNSGSTSAPAGSVVIPSSFQIATGGTPRVNVDANGSLSILTAGQGLKLPNSNSSDTDTLDWYEEGVWTPGILGETTAGVGTYNTNTGRYSRIGDTCFISGYINVSNHTGTGEMLLGGLPFAGSSTNAHIYSIVPSYCTGLSTTPNSILKMYVQNAFIRFKEQVSGAVMTTGGVSVDPLFTLYFSGTYKV